MATDQEIEHPLFLTLLLTIACIDKVLRLTWQDVNFIKRTVTLWTRKRNGGSYEADPMPMNQDLYEVLWRLWQTRKQDNWVFFNAKAETRYHKRPKFMKGLYKRAFAPAVKKSRITKGLCSDSTRSGISWPHTLPTGKNALQRRSSGF